LDNNKTKIGKITHFFDNILVAVLELTDGSVKIGDTIFIGQEETGFDQKVSSMQVDHQSVDEAKKGDEVGLKVDQAVKKGDIVYKV